MRKRDKKKERREILSALAMITQIGLAMMTCMVISFGIGFYLDRLLGTKYWVMIFLLIGIMASIRSLFILTRNSTKDSSLKGETDAGSKEDTH